MISIPPYLKPGDTIGVLCPAGYMPEENAATAIQTLKDWGYRVVKGATLGKQFNYFSGTDDERLDDLQRMLDDETIHAIFCARGGYGMGRIIDRLNFKKFKKNPKWIIGFSDITVLQSHILANYKIASLHAPMAAAFNKGVDDNEYIQSLRDALIGRKAVYSCPGHEYNQKGKADGVLVGGNLSLLAHLCGSSSEVNTEKKILFIEDVGEYIYNVDRMLHQLKRCGKLDELSGIVVGRFTDMKDTTIPFGQGVEEVIQNVVKEYSYPVCFNFPVSHEKENLALKIGVKYELSVSVTSVQLEEF